MPESVSEEEIYDSRYIARAVEDILRDRFGHMRLLNDFYGDGKFSRHVEPFKESSALHDFIAFVADDIIREDSYAEAEDEEGSVTFSETGKSINGATDTPLLIEKIFDFYGVEHTSFDEQFRDKGNDPILGITSDDIDDYFDDLLLSGEYEALLNGIAKEVFPILFHDRNLLKVFNNMMANQVGKSELEEIEDDYADFFSESGILNDVTVPFWVRETVNFRDRGKCAKCFDEIPEFDVSSSNRFCHMISLTDGGLNDVTNIQILCRGCDPDIPEDPRQRSLW